MTQSVVESHRIKAYLWQSGKLILTAYSDFIKNDVTLHKNSFSLFSVGPSVYTSLFEKILLSRTCLMNLAFSVRIIRRYKDDLD